MRSWNRRICIRDARSIPASIFLVIIAILHSTGLSPKWHTRAHRIECHVRPFDFDDKSLLVCGIGSHGPPVES